MNTILVPTDFSNTADNALNYAIDFANAYRLDITLLHVVSIATVGAVNSLATVSNAEEQLALAEKHMIEKVTDLSESNPDITFHYQVEMGFLGDSLKELGKQINPVVICMGITGEGTTIDKIIGSNAVSALHDLVHPIIIVPQKANFKPIEKICFACDLKHVIASLPVVAIRAFAKLFNAEVNILNIDYHNRNFSENTPHELKDLAQLLSDVKHSFHFIEDDDVQHAISNFAEKENMDMVVILPKKHNIMDRLFHKSHSTQLAYQSHIPVLALHQM